ncbi:MAG: hypothetical protein M1835_005752 [Candelina submexicana]|nr:MAG: hypothetical protein M1835_005752 [Candelina submexicana]
MKTYQALSFLLALSASSTVLAAPAPASTDPSSDDSSINNSKLQSDKLRASDDLKAAPVAAASNGRCIDITFTSTNPDWNYYFNGDWGLETGKVSQLKTRSLCGSGAMFVGAQTKGNGLGSAAGGNTKLECTVVGDGKPDNVCDVSVVDGYSLSMHCTGFGTGDIGGTRNLFDLGRCPKVNNNGHTCVNTNGHTNNADQFFKNGGKYWYQDNVYVGTTFSGTPRITCAIEEEAWAQEDDVGLDPA